MLRLQQVLENIETNVEMFTFFALKNTSVSYSDTDANAFKFFDPNPEVNSA